MTGPTTRTMLHDGVNVIAEYASGGALRYRWVHAPGLDEPLVQYHAGEVPGRYWLIADERGSVVTRTNGSGIRTQVNVYDEYANTVSTHTSGSPGRFGYAGALWFDETGLYHMRNRAYNPRMMRFMQADPIGHSGGMNLYAYVGGDPVNFSDPWGLSRLVKQVPHDPPPPTDCDGKNACLENRPDTIRVIGQRISWEEREERERQRSLRDFFNDMRAQLETNDTFKSDHDYSLSTTTLCSADTAFAFMGSRYMSAPGAPQVRSGRRDVELLFGNRITQTVNPQDRMILNQTLSPHRYHPGNVLIRVEPYMRFFSRITITGTGLNETRLEALENEFVGKAFFGTSAQIVRLACQQGGFAVR